jgi:hypothetical protein
MMFTFRRTSRPRRRVFSRITLLLVLVVSVGCSFAYGFLCNARQLPPYGLARRVYTWAREQTVLRTCARLALAEEEPGDASSGAHNLTGSQRRAIARLSALGYARGYEAASERHGVTEYDSALAYNGLNLCVSAHAPVAILMDMEGTVLHKWARTFHEAFPDDPDRSILPSRECYRRVYLYENGDLLAIYHGHGLVKLDKHSNVIWANPCTAHHDLFVDEEGLIYTLTWAGKVVPSMHETEPVRLDFITVLHPDGCVLRNVSVLEAFERSSYASCLDKMPRSGDAFHTNTIEVLDGSLADRSPAFKKGNVLISVLKGNLIAVVDINEEKVVWALSGQWVAQHQPTVLDSGNILLLDNRGHYGMSKVIELDLFTQQIAWAYGGDAANGFYTETCGSCQRLPNGNTLITESDSGRAFEVASDGRVVWKYYNPNRAGEDHELIATLFEVVRLPPDFPTDWVVGPGLALRRE